MIIRVDASIEEEVAAFAEVIAARLQLLDIIQPGFVQIGVGDPYSVPADLDGPYVVAPLVTDTARVGPLAKEQVRLAAVTVACSTQEALWIRRVSPFSPIVRAAMPPEGAARPASPLLRFQVEEVMRGHRALYDRLDLESGTNAVAVVVDACLEAVALACAPTPHP